MKKNWLKRFVSFFSRTLMNVGYWIKELFYWVAYRIPDRIERFFSGIQDFFERGKKGYAVSDTWDLNMYLAKVISGSVDKMSSDMYGVPFGFTYKQWKAGLKQVSGAFRDYIEFESGEDTYSEESRKRYKLISKRVKKACKFLGEHWGNLWD